MNYTIELTREEREVLREVITDGSAHFKDYMREAFMAGDVLAVKSAARKEKVIAKILEKIKE